MPGQAEAVLKAAVDSATLQAASAHAGRLGGENRWMQEKARILVVEDEPAIREAVLSALRDAGYRAEGRGDVDDFAAVVDVFRPDLAVLDVMLPGRDGFALAADLRRRCDAAVLFLTARDAVCDRLRGFAAGGDDYLVKPFVMAELLARVTAILRRLGRVPSAVEVGDLLLDEEAGIAVRAGSALELTATELRLPPGAGVPARLGDPARPGATRRAARRALRRG